MRWNGGVIFAKLCDRPHETFRRGIFLSNEPQGRGKEARIHGSSGSNDFSVVAREVTTHICEWPRNLPVYRRSKLSEEGIATRAFGGTS